MSLVPIDISVYYSPTDNNVLFQGDLISSSEIGIETGATNPDYWLIITKNCDLAFRSNERKVKNDVLTLLGIYSIEKHIKLLKSKYLKQPKTDFLCRVVLAGVLKFSTSTSSITKKEHLNDLINDKISKLMFLPPDGKIMQEPMIVDFDFIYPLHEEKIEDVLKAKKLQLSSPFRERLSQRFANHYSSIGIDDNNVKTTNYKNSLTQHFESVRKK